MPHQLLQALSPSQLWYHSDQHAKQKSFIPSDLICSALGQEAGRLAKDYSFFKALAYLLDKLHHDCIQSGWQR